MDLYLENRDSEASIKKKNPLSVMHWGIRGKRKRFQTVFHKTEAIRIASVL